MNRRDFLELVGTGGALSLMPRSSPVFAISDPTMRRSTPESQGISSSAILAFVDETEATIGPLRSLMIARHGQVVAEGWWSPFAPSLNHWLFSLSKSFTSTAIGIAQSEGLLSLDDTVISFFPDELPPEPSNNLKSMRIRDLLRLTHGTEAADAILRSDDPQWVRSFLAMDVTNTPGTLWAYSNTAPYILSAILQKLTGEHLVDYLRPRLFEPLGIRHPVWRQSPEGIDLGGSGLRLTTEDVLRFGQLYLQNGRWEGQQLLPASWVAEATTRQASNGSNPSSDSQQGYGFLFWMTRHPRVYYAGGAYGQNCIVMANQDAVVATTAGVRFGAMQPLLDLVWKHILPAMNDTPLAEDPGLHGRLQSRLDGLTVPTPEGEMDSPTLHAISGRRYMFSPNDRSIESMTLTTAPDHDVLTLVNHLGEHHIPCGRGTWTASTTQFEPPAHPMGGPSSERTEVPCAASGAWTAQNTYTVRLFHTEAPFLEELTFRFALEKVTFDQIGQRPQLVGLSL